MASFTLAEETDWIQPVIFGEPDDRWRLDDYDIYLHVARAPGDDPVLELSTLDGTLTISDAASRRLEINVAWNEMADLRGGYLFDFLFIDRTTGIRTRNGPHTLAITPGITFAGP